MASPRSRRIDVEQAPELAKIADEVQATGEPAILARDGKDVARITPIRPRRRSSSRARPVTEDDPLLRLIGKFSSGIPGGMSGRKHEFLKKV
jgi:antitoxin (DNA-binding transcriptional repressor) of toxin-antitoxin stability system